MFLPHDIAIVRLFFWDRHMAGERSIPMTLSHCARPSSGWEEEEM